VNPPVSLPPEIAQDAEPKSPDADREHVVPEYPEPETEMAVPVRPDAGLRLSVGWPDGVGTVKLADAGVAPKRSGVTVTV
jgi:hypothetical protein